MGTMKARCLATVAVLTVAGSCSAVAADMRRPDDPSAVTPSVRYAPVLRGTRSYRPVDPKPWAATNESVAPQEARRPAAPAKDKEGR